MKKHEKKISKIHDIIKEHIKRNIKEYFIVSIVFLIGVILGIIFINNSNVKQKDEIQTYLSTFTNELNNDYKIDTTKLLTTSIINNIILTLALWFIGSTVIGIPIVFIIVGLRGFTLGYTISSIMITYSIWKGILFTFCTLFLQNIIIIPCIFALAVSGIKLYKSILRDKRKENIKIEIFRHTMLSGCIALLLVFSSLIETYISTSLLITCISVFT